MIVHDAIGEDLPFVKVTADGVYMGLYIRPKAKSTEIVGVHDQRLKIQLTSPPIEGKANGELRCFLAKTLLFNFN